MALMLFARSERHRSVRVQTTLALPHMATLEVRLQALDHPPLRSLVATLRALRPLGRVPLRRTFLDIRQLAELRLQWFLCSLTLPILHDHLVSDAVDEPRLGQIETVACARTPRSCEPIAHHALVLAGALSTRVRSKSLVASVCVGRRSIAKNGSILNSSSAFRAALRHPFGGQPRTLLRTTLNAPGLTMVDPGRIADDRKGAIRSGWRFLIVVLGCLGTVAGLVDIRSVSHAGSFVHLNNPIVGQFLDATHVSRLNGHFVLGSTVAFRPLGGLPKCGTRFRVASQLVLIHHWLVHVDTLLGRRDFRRTLADTLDDGRLDSTATSLRTSCEFYHLP